MHTQKIEKMSLAELLFSHGRFAARFVYNFCGIFTTENNCPAAGAAAGSVVKKPCHDKKHLRKGAVNEAESIRAPKRCAADELFQQPV